jgi:hypothetical protein
VRSASILFIAVLVAACDKDGGSKGPVDAGGLRVMPATYAEHSNASEEARAKCKFDSELTDEVAEVASEAKVGKGILSLKITRMRGAEPAWEGEISVIVEGELEQDGTMIGNFRLQRRALGGVGGGMAGVCNGLEDIAEEMAHDIATWLEHPKEDSELGG